MILADQVGRAAVMIAVAVGDDDVLDARRVEAEAAQAALDQLGGFLAVVEGVDQDDAVGRVDRPGADPFRADVVEIVERLARRRRAAC